MAYEPIAHLLTPIQGLLADRCVSEILIDAPQTVWYEKEGAIQPFPVPLFTYLYLERLATQIATFSSKSLQQDPLLIASLPDGSRVQIVMPPATRAGHILFAIRRQTIRCLELSDYERQGAFRNTSAWQQDAQKNSGEAEKKLTATWRDQHYFDFLMRAIALKKNIVISAGTGVGKTTFLNACLAVIALDERIGIIEDVAEISIPHARQFRLLAGFHPKTQNSITTQHLVKAALRLRPDRLILGEIRGAEAWDFLQASATGHEGSLTTLHASSPDLALMRLVHMVKQNPQMAAFTREAILADILAIVDIVVQLKREPMGEGEDYHRRISHIAWLKSGETTHEI